LQAIWFAALVSSANQWAASEMTMPQFKVLLLLAARDTAPVNWLAARLNVSSPNITGILDRLGGRGWVYRSTDPHDRRVVRVAISPAGLSLLWNLCAGGAAGLAEETSALPQEDERALRRGLGALVGALE
jgi:DNA-binding MarR family transcriptional regulator